MRLIVVLLGLVVITQGVVAWRRNTELTDALRQRDEARRLAVGLHSRGRELMLMCRAQAEYVDRLERACPMYIDL